ncbi:MAG: type IV pilus twitching motility protein PilT [Firmicutes bacterium]|nr:type IV pilus twitching motility protein PilT [Bacillota bacterium]
MDQLLNYTLENHASDLHITVGIPPMVRIDGKLYPVEGKERLLPDDTKELVKLVASEDSLAKLDEDGQIDMSYSLPGVGRFRVNIYKQRGSYSMAIRSVPLEIPTIDELDLPDIIKDLSLKKRGLILVTGPTGSGKSTTLAAMINHINENKNCHILTLEDPIEYLHKHGTSIVNQREIGHDSSTYAKALRAALRQDPDVILIGEMRDLETISTAITAAETGHLVLSTLHTVGAVSTVDRIIDVFPPNQQQQIRIQLSNVLQGVVSQQLLKKKDVEGRRAAMEIMICNPAIRNHIREGKTHQILSSMQTGGRFGMITMDNYILKMYRENLISRESALTSAIDQEYVSRVL